MTRIEIRARRVELEAQRRTLREQTSRLNREFEKLFLDCDHPNLKTGTDRTNYPEYWCDDCGMDKEGIYIPR